MTPVPTDLADVSLELMMACARFTRLSRTLTEPDESPATWRALATLAELGPLRITDFARAEMLTQPAATALVNRLATSGLAARTADPDDARAVLVRLTPAGREHLTELRHRVAGRLAPHVARLDEEQVRLLQAAASLLGEITATPRTPAPAAS